MTARLLPWTELLAAIGEARFEEVRASLQTRGTDDLDRDAFLLDPAAVNLLRDLVPEEAPAEAVTAYAALLHMMHACWARDWPLASVGPELLRVALTRTSHLTPRTPPTVCYVQLPERLVWAEASPGEPHEPMDGIFLVAGARLQTVAVLGLRSGRDGFTTMEGDLALPAAAPGAREDGTPPFASRLPGGDLARLLGVANPHELGALALLALATAEG